MTAQEMKDLATAKWRSSGLPDLAAAKLRLKAIDGKAAGRLAPKFAGAACLMIPYFDDRGRETKFYRLRRLDSKGWDAQSGKVQRYAQPAGTAPEVYMPPLFPEPWADVLKNPKLPILITEGELKAASACAVKIRCLGLGGVDSWRSKKRGIELVPVLDRAEWTDRPVTIVFDSDAAANPNVMRAQNALASELRFRGADVRIASLPPGPEGQKQGLDDLIVARGRKGVEATIDDAPPLEESSPLWALNEEVAFVREPGLVVVRETCQKLGPDPFVRHHYANRRHVVETDDGPKVLETAKEWMRWPHRFEVQRITYEPGMPRLVGDKFNVWKGLGVEPEKGDVAPFVELVDFVLDGVSAEHKRWFWRWMAYPLQHPGAKMFSCVALWSPEQGVGKTLIAYVLKDIYGSNGLEIKNKDLDSAFNSYIEAKQFVIGDEITGSDSRGFADQLKGLITQEEVRVNAKYVPEYVVPDRVNWFFTSNHADAFYVEDSDRRFFIHQVRGKPREKAFYKRVDRWRDWRDGRGTLKGARHLLHHLLHLDLGDFDPKAHAPVTAAKQAMAYDTKSDVARWVADLKENPGSLLMMGEVPMTKDLFTPSELLTIYDPHGVKGVKANGLGRELAKAFERLPKNATSQHGSQNLYAVRNAGRWLKASPTERSAHWEGAAAPRRKEAKY